MMSRRWSLLLQSVLVAVIAIVVISAPTGVAASCTLPASLAEHGTGVRTDVGDDHASASIDVDSARIASARQHPADPCGKTKPAPKNEALASPLHLAVAGVLPDRVTIELEYPPRFADAHQFGTRGASPPPESPPPQA